MEFFIKLYDSSHCILDEVYEISDIEYGFTVNGIGKAIINVPYYADKTNDRNYRIGNDIEIYRIEDNKEILEWYGVIYNSIPNGSDLEVECYGYGRKVQDRMFTQYITEGSITLRGTYDKVIYSMLSNINSYMDTGIRQGKAQSNTLETERIINWNDNFYDKLDEFTTDSNYYWDINEKRELNLSTSIGSNKTYYEINDEVNVVDTINISTSGEIYNHVIAKNTYTEDDSDVEVTLISESKDEDSIALYGLHSKELSVNDIHIQETLDEYVKRELEKCSSPILSLTLEVSNSGTFNIFNVKKGDVVTLKLSSLKMDTSIKVLDYKIKPTKETMIVTLGNCYFRENSVQKYRF